MICSQSFSLFTSRHVSEVVYMLVCVRVCVLNMNSSVSVLQYTPIAVYSLSECGGSEVLETMNGTLVRQR